MKNRKIEECGIGVPWNVVACAKPHQKTPNNTKKTQKKHHKTAQNNAKRGKMCISPKRWRFFFAV